MSGSTQPSELEVYFLQLVNTSRAAAGLTPLVFDRELIGASQGHSDWMLAADVFSHTGAGGSSPGDRMAAAGYGANGWGENVAWIGGPGADLLDRADVEMLHANLMNSPGHRANILNGGFTEIGIGLTQGDYKGMPAVFVTEDFASPNAQEAVELDKIPYGTTSAPAPTPAPAPTATPTTPAAPAPTSASPTAGSGANTLVLKLAQDAWQGDAQYTVKVDGTGVGGVFSAAALRSSGAQDTITLKGNWGAGAHKVEVTFLNDAWGGSSAADRNLYFNALSYDGVERAVGKALYSNGTASADFGSAAPVATELGGTGSGTVSSSANDLVLGISQDAWNGDAQYVVKVDGAQVGGLRTAHASHAVGQSEAVTISGLTAGKHDVSVTFLNDAWGGTANTDRNLYVDVVTVNGQEVAQAEASLYRTGTATFQVDVWG